LEVNGQLQSLATLPLWKNTPTELEAGWAPEAFWTFQSKLFLLPVFKLLTAQPIA